MVVPKKVSTYLRHLSIFPHITELTIHPRKDVIHRQLACCWHLHLGLKRGLGAHLGFGSGMMCGKKTQRNVNSKNLENTVRDECVAFKELKRCLDIPKQVEPQTPHA